MPDVEVWVAILKIAVVFFAISFVVFWVGLVWWVGQDVLSRTTDKIIVATAVTFACIFGPIGVLLYLIVRPRQTIKENYREFLETEINQKLAAMDMSFCPFCGAELDLIGRSHVTNPEQLALEELVEELAPEAVALGTAAGVLPMNVIAKPMLSVRATQGLVKAGRYTVSTLRTLLTPRPVEEAVELTVVEAREGMEEESVAQTTTFVPSKAPAKKTSAKKKPTKAKGTRRGK